MTVTTTTQLAGLYNDILEAALETLFNQTVMLPLVTRYTGTGFADRKITQFNTASAQIVAEGQDYSNPTAFEKSLVTTFTPQMRASQYIITDHTIATDDVDSIVARAGTNLGQAIAQAVDLDLLGEFPNLPVSLGAAGSALTVKHLAGAKTLMYNANARGTFYVVLHPNQWHDIWIELGMPSANQAFLGDVANQAMREFYVNQMWGNVSIFLSNNIKVDESDDAIGAMFSREAIAIDVRKPATVEVERDASAFLTEWTISAAYDTGLLRETHGVKLISDATDPS